MSKFSLAHLLEVIRNAVTKIFRESILVADEIFADALSKRSDIVLEKTMTYYDQVCLSQRDFSYIDCDVYFLAEAHNFESKFGSASSI